MKFTEVKEFPRSATGVEAVANPFEDIVAELIKEFATKGTSRIIETTYKGNKALVGRWNRQLTEAAKPHNVTVYRAITPRVSTAKTPGVDDTADRTITFYVGEKTKRGRTA